MPFKRGSGLAVNTIYFGKCYRWIMGEERLVGGGGLPLCVTRWV